MQGVSSLFFLYSIILGVVMKVLQRGAPLAQFVLVLWVMFSVNGSFAQSSAPIAEFPTFNGGVNAIAVAGNTIYVGGSFTQATNSPQNGGATLTRTRLAAVSAATGEILPWSPSANDIVNTIATDGATVYVGGIFTIVNGQTRNRIAALDASGNLTAWNPNPSGLQVSAIALANGTVYVGGAFSAIGGQGRNSIAALSPITGLATAWNPNASGIVTNILGYGSNIYLAGGFSNVGGQSRFGFAEIDANTGLATALNRIVFGNQTLATDGIFMYLGGGFTTINATPRNKIARINIATGNIDAWNPNALGTQRVSSILPTNNGIFAGGTFTTIGGQARNYLAKLEADGTSATWNPNIAGVSVNTLAQTTDILLVGGTFATVGGQTRANFAAFSLQSNALTSFSPTSGGAGTTVILRGNGFIGASAVSVGGIPVESFTVNSNNQITAVLGAGQPTTGGAQLVTVTVPGSVLSLGGFMYGAIGTPPSGNPPRDTTIPPTPRTTVYSIDPAQFTFGTPIRIYGAELTNATGLLIGGVPVSNFRVLDDNNATGVVGAVPLNDRIQVTGVPSIFLTFSGIGVQYLRPQAPTVTAFTTNGQLTTSSDNSSIFARILNLRSDASAFIQEGFMAGTGLFANSERFAIAMTRRNDSTDVVFTLPDYLRTAGIKTITVVNPDGQYASFSITVLPSATPLTLVNANDGTKSFAFTVSLKTTTIPLRGIGIDRTANAVLRSYSTWLENGKPRLLASFSVPIRVHNSTSASAELSWDFVSNVFSSYWYLLFQDFQLVVVNNDGSADSIRISMNAPPRPIVRSTEVQHTANGRNLIIRGKNFFGDVGVFIGQFITVKLPLVRPLEGDSLVIARIPEDFTTRKPITEFPTVFGFLTNPDRASDFFRLASASLEPEAIIGQSMSYSAENFNSFATNPAHLANNSEERFETLAIKHQQSDEPSGFIIAPNPTDNLVYIRLGNTDVIASVRVRDTRGALLKETVQPTSTIALGALSAGTYIIEVQTVAGQTFRRFISKR